MSASHKTSDNYDPSTCSSTHLLHDLDQPQRDLVDTPPSPPPRRYPFYQAVHRLVLRGRRMLEERDERGGLLVSRVGRFHLARFRDETTVVEDVIVIVIVIVMEGVERAVVV